jgi:transcriptional regulator with XRE-family HTH domain
MGIRGRKTPGQRLRALRESRGLTIGEVQRRTKRLALTKNAPQLAVWKSRLSDIETSGRTPSIYALSALAQTYGVNIQQLLRWYGA